MYQMRIMPVRQVNGKASIIDICGEVTASTEAGLLRAYTEAARAGIRTIVLNLSQMDYMDSSGIGILIGLIIRAQREGRGLLSYGLSPHYRELFAITQLDRAIAIYNTEREALTAASQKQTETEAGRLRKTLAA